MTARVPKRSNPVQEDEVRASKLPAGMRSRVESATSVIPDEAQQSLLPGSPGKPGKSDVMETISIKGCDTVSTISAEDQTTTELDAETERPQGAVAAALRSAYNSVLERSLLLPEDQRLVMYDPHDANEVRIEATRERRQARSQAERRWHPRPNVPVHAPHATCRWPRRPACPAARGCGPRP